ncbi:YdcF family protein [Candidatus Cyanaurora vandensis]|uniref:YdcF family protein n=1 Tax=Candidatus Cyanaurora vandensis TaxID=2714958 RepID=UPI00257CEF68|nr:YdcF family protein [Candidatus Cyanaurora vandensis]
MVLSKATSLDTPTPPIYAQLRIHNKRIFSVSLYLSKILSLLLYPLGLSIVLWTLSQLWFRFPRLARGLGLVALAILVIFSTPVVSQALLGSLENQFPTLDPITAPRAGGMVVLGGAMRSPSSRHSQGELVEASDRLLHALRLYRAQKAPWVLITGGNIEFLGAAQVPEARAARELLVEWGLDRTVIRVEDQSRNTYENAQFTRRQLAGFRGQILLVTSAYHMPRAVAVFRRAGFTVIPAPTDYLTGWGEPDGIFQWLPRAEALADSTVALKEWLGLWVYRLRGWA